MFGQRSDRRFDKFQSFDLKLIADIINECEFDEVIVFDPHSDVTMALIDRSTKKTSFEYVEKAVLDIMEKQLLTDGFMTDLLLVSPDAGAFKKVFEYGKELNLPVMGAMKHRDRDGKIDLMFTHDVSGKDCLIVDDLCDGGYTFVVLAKELRKQGARKVYLYVSHGLFSKGFMELHRNIDHIYTTNSVKDLGNAPIDEEVEWADWHQGHLPMKVPEVYDFVTQFKVI
jgi:ribose-phosphate pyrophosphokinase